MQLLTFDLALIVIWSKNNARSHPLHIIHTTTTTTPCLKPKDILRFTLTTKNGCLKSCITALLQTWSIFNLSFHLFAAQHYLAWHIQFSASFSLFKWFIYEISGWAYVTLTKIVCVYVCISKILSFYSVFYKLPGLSGFVDVLSWLIAISD